MDAVFRALADPSRRKLLDRLYRRDGQTLTEMCERISMTRFGVMKHLRVLEEAGLVATRKEGREKLHFLDPVPIRLVHDRWVSKYRAPFAAALVELKSRLEATQMAETQVYQVFIRTTPQKLWQALTDGEVTKRYFFGETVHSDWKAGSEWHSTGPEGSRDVEGKVVESDPPRRLVMTWRALYDPELSSELSRVTYLIEKRGEVCKLAVTHELADAPKTGKHVSKDGWTLILSTLKTLLETGEPMPMPEQAG
jgi:uncharacterized protein YndB with AHSA1/START domain/DNA-binding transcriptional ArsR family regulator